MLEALLGLVILTALAELILRLLDVKTFLVPKPTTVAQSFADNWDVLWTNSIVTLKEILLGFAVASMGGFLLAILVTYVPLLGRVLLSVLIVPPRRSRRSRSPRFLSSGSASDSRPRSSLSS